jgi:hypothetical protein
MDQFIQKQIPFTSTPATATPNTPNTPATATTTPATTPAATTPTNTNTATPTNTNTANTTFAPTVGAGDINKHVPDVVLLSNEEVKKYAKMLYDIVDEIKKQFLPNIPKEQLNLIILEAINLVEDQQVREGLRTFTKSLLEIFAKDTAEVTEKLEKIILGLVGIIPGANIITNILSTFEIIINVFRKYGQIADDAAVPIEKFTGMFNPDNFNTNNLTKNIGLTNPTSIPIKKGGHVDKTRHAKINLRHLRRKNSKTLKRITKSINDLMKSDRIKVKVKDKDKAR